MKDVRHILGVFDKMVERGNTVWVIEHNTDVIKAADYVVEMGPGAGEYGGTVTFAGMPAEMSACPDSITAKYL